MRKKEGEVVIVDEEQRQRARMSETDADVCLFLDHFHSFRGAKCLVVGAHDEGTANILADIGLDVYGVDLREYDKELPPCNYHFLRADFCDLPPAFTYAHHGSFDIAVSLSCIEHMGMGAYMEGRIHPYYDVIAMRKMWEFLKVGGSAFITIPFSGFYTELWPHWRVYNLPAALERLVQDFDVLNIHSMSAGKFMLHDRRLVKFGEILTQDEVDKHTGFPPHVSTLLHLKKKDIKRLSPDGR